MDILNRIKELSVLEPKTLEQMCLKLMEETGECAQALLSSSNVSGCSYKELTNDHVKEECIDVLIIATSLLYKLGATDEEIERVASVKIDKWESKIVK